MKAVAFVLLILVAAAPVHADGWFTQLLTIGSWFESQPQAKEIALDEDTAAAIEQKIVGKLERAQAAAAAECEELRSKFAFCGFMDELQAEFENERDALESSCQKQLTECHEDTYKIQEQAYKDGFEAGKEHMRQQMDTVQEFRMPAGSTCREFCGRFYDTVDGERFTYECAFAQDTDGSIKSCDEYLSPDEGIISSDYPYCHCVQP